MGLKYLEKYVNHVVEEEDRWGDEEDLLFINNILWSLLSIVITTCVICLWFASLHQISAVRMMEVTCNCTICPIGPAGSVG